MGKIKELSEQFKVPTRIIDSFVKFDFTGSQKYLEYMLKLYSKRTIYGYGVKDIKDNILNFHQLLPYITNKDIYSKDYNTYPKLRLIIGNAEDLREEKTFIREDHIDILDETDDYILLVPKTFRGSCKYGKGTRWCTTSKGESYRFNDYTTTGSLFYYVPKNNDNNGKFAFHIINKNALLGTITTYNASDSTISTESLIKYGFKPDELLKFTLLMRAYASKRAHIILKI